MNLATISIHKDKGRHHLDNGLTCFIKNRKATVAKEPIVSQGFCLNSDLLCKARQTSHINIVIRDNPY